MVRMHSTALVDARAEIGVGTTIGPYSIIEAGAVLGPECEIGPYVWIRGGARLAEGVKVDAHSVIGGEPQDLKFDASMRTHVEIGARTVIREGVTIHRSTKEEQPTVIGADCLLMGYCHVAHDVRIGERVIIANTALCAGHTEVGDHAFVSGAVALHQHMRVGEGAMMRGHARFGLDVAPFTVGSEKNEIRGLNLIGLRRRGIAREPIYELKRLYLAVYGGGGNLRAKAAALSAEHGPGQRFLEFFAGGTRGFAPWPKAGRGVEEDS